MSSGQAKFYPTKTKKIISSNIQPANSLYNSKVWPKKSLKIESDFKDLRETGATLSQTPKNNMVITRELKPTDFQYLQFLGNGKFGSVYMARHIQTGFIFAMKIIQKSIIICQSTQESTKMLNQLISQIKIQLFLDHPNIIKLYSFFSDEYKIYLLLESAPDGQLYQFMKLHKVFTQQSSSFLMRQVLLGISYMHDCHVIHRDIKPQNIVVIHGIPKICDFGWSVYCPKQFRSTLCGTPLYLSPQILRGQSYNEKIDTWAIGTLSYELLTGQNPFKITKKSQISKIVTQNFIMQTGSSSTKQFLQLALQKQPQKRITAKMMLQHSFIRKYEELETCQELCRIIYKQNKQKQKNMLQNKSKYSDNKMYKH